MLHVKKTFSQLILPIICDFDLFFKLHLSSSPYHSLKLYITGLFFFLQLASIQEINSDGINGCSLWVQTLWRRKASFKMAENSEQTSSLGECLLPRPVDWTCPYQRAPTMCNYKSNIIPECQPSHKNAEWSSLTIATHSHCPHVKPTWNWLS